MLEKQIVITQEGLDKLEKELEELKVVKRKEISEKIKVATAFGDLSENSEYDEAKNEQGMIESRINEIEQLFKRVTVLDESDLSTDSISIGSVVTVKNIKNDKVATYKVVGSTEASPKEKKISDESPMGSGLLGHKVGEIVDIDAPAGIIQYEIIEISK